jgi:hypothetical protein
MKLNILFGYSLVSWFAVVFELHHENAVKLGKIVLHLGFEALQIRVPLFWHCLGPFSIH